MNNLRGSPNSRPGILTVEFNNLEHINIYTELNIPCIYANLKEKSWNKIRDIFVFKLNRYRADLQERQVVYWLHAP